MLALKRLRPRAGLFLALFAVVLLLSGLAVGLTGYLSVAGNAGARTGLAALSGNDGGFRIITPLADGADAEAQDERIRAAIATLRGDGRALPVIVSRDIATRDSVSLESSGSAASPGPHAVGVTIASIPDLEGRADLTGGRWPTSPDEATLQADAADRLRIAVGDVLALPDGTPMTVVGTWRVRDPDDPRWLGEGSMLVGRPLLGSPGFLVIDPALWPSTGVVPEARWTVQPDAARVTAVELSALRTASDTVGAVIRAGEETPGRIVQSGRLRLSIAPIERNVRSTAAVATAPLIVVGVLGLIMLLELARVLEQLRREENALLRARGTTDGQFELWAGAEAAAAVVPAAAIGSIGAALAITAIGSPTDVSPLGWALAGVVAAVAIGAVAASAGRESRDISRGSAPRGMAAQRARGVVGIGAVLLLVLAAVVAVSQFLLYGSPLVPTADGGVAIDPLAVSAPALAIAAAGLLLVAAFPLAARAIERIADRLRGFRFLPLRQLARRSRAALTSILVLAFAVSGVVFAAAYSGTWSAGAAETRAVRIGTDLRITDDGGIPAEVRAPAPGQTAAAPGLSTDGQIGDSGTTIVALPHAAIGAVVATVAGAVDPAELGNQLSDADVRPSLPTDATGVRVGVTSTRAGDEPLELRILLSDSSGSLRELSMQRTASGYTADLPASDGEPAGWTLRGLRLELPAVRVGADIEFDVTAIGGAGGDARVRIEGRWEPAPGPLANPSAKSDIVGLHAGRLGVHAAAGDPGGSFLLVLAPASGTLVPIVISQGLASSSGLEVGAEPVVTVVGSGGLPAVVVGISPVTPGSSSGEGILADLATFQDGVLRANLGTLSANQWWVSTDDVDAAGMAATAAAPIGVEVETRGPLEADLVLGSARVVVWIAAAATAALTLLSIAAGLLTELRGRRGEVGVLRSLGLNRHEQGITRALEWGVLLALGLIAGIVAGGLVSALLVGSLARAAVPGAVPGLLTPFRIDPLEGGAALGLLALALAILLLGTARAVSRQADASVADGSRG
ncbi:FtsX-like permease family protein [Naasia lichenicola]|uniref:ABC3 transporter permease C-terminal domain-containing protein n=1 Tax=Naasia lichenicola TaxID=2565933 RepID=A0A4S4FNY6_9MICO|nr:FtsX-like permease family protein [Naasia lichenicola]THG30986.1 hypothetical protein E6C64_10295 [Naasia lichenicola]